MPFLLNRCLHPDDLTELAEEVAAVDAIGIGEQHPMRRWEYALAIRAWNEYAALRSPRPVAVCATDVGGAGSSFAQILASVLPPPRKGATNSVVILDPALPEPPVVDGPVALFPRSLADLVHFLSPQLQDAVFCLSVLEHVDDLDQFLYHLACLVEPGGLLVLTMDYWDQPTNTAHFHWMRNRIFNPTSYMNVRGRLSIYGFETFGGIDGQYGYPEGRGNHVYDYQFASLCLRRRP